MAGSVTAHIPGRGDDGLHQIRSNNNHLSGILQKMLQEKIQLYVNLFGVCGTIMVLCDNLVFHNQRYDKFWIWSFGSQNPLFIV